MIEAQHASTVAEAVARGELSGRLWLYSNYHCNLRCTYCLTESAPGVARRELQPEAMLAAAHEARSLGFTGLGVTGGEPFLVPEMPALLASLAEILPVVVLSNATLFYGRRLEALAPLASAPVHIQVSLDRADPDDNDEMRGPENFRRVVEAIPRLVERGIGVRISTTLADPGSVAPEELERLCELHRSLGVPDSDHVVRPVVRRGRAASADMGVAAAFDQLDPELTLTGDGAFWSPIGPTVRDGRLDTDMLLTRTTAPLATPAAALMDVLSNRRDGEDARLGIK